LQQERDEWQRQRTELYRYYVNIIKDMDDTIRYPQETSTRTSRSMKISTQLEQYQSGYEAQALLIKSLQIELGRKLTSSHAMQN